MKSTILYNIYYHWNYINWCLKHDNYNEALYNEYLLHCYKRDLKNWFKYYLWSKWFKKDYSDCLNDGQLPF